MIGWLISGTILHPALVNNAMVCFIRLASHISVSAVAIALARIGVIMICLPPNTTQLLQPLGKLQA